MEQGIINVLMVISLVGLAYVIFKFKCKNDYHLGTIKQLLWKISMLESELNKIKCNGEENEHTKPDNKTQTLAKHAILHDCIDNLNDQKER